MSINKNNGSLTDIFKDFYAEGSDGTGISQDPPTNDTDLIINFETAVFEGRLFRQNEALYFETLGGGIFKVEMEETVSTGQLLDQRIKIQGIQVEDTITNAIPYRTVTPVTQNRFRGLNKEQWAPLIEAVRAFASAYIASVDGLLTARPGYKYINGEITKIPAILAIVDKKINYASLNRGQLLPEKFQNYDVEVVEASPEDYIKYKELPNNKELASVLPLMEPSLLESMVIDGTDTETNLPEAGEMRTGYVPPPNVQLEEVTAAMTLICHVSPEGGWKTLAPFLEDTNEQLQVAMYDFSAPHLFEKLKSILKQGISLKLVYDSKEATNVGKGTKLYDVEETKIITSFKRIAGNGFEYMPAWKGNDGICNNAYHVKVAVKDKKSFWLSSGNWQSSNQPDKDFEVDPKMTKDYNREWNVVVTNEKLAKIFHAFIDWDFEKSGEKPEAALFESVSLPDLYTEKAELEDAQINSLVLFPPRKFVFTRTKPLRIQPVFTPDNYIEHALSVIRLATETLYFQNQYIKISANVTPEYEELLYALRDVTNDNRIDCRIILRTPFSTADKMKMMNDLQAYEFNMSKIRFMNNTHTKGIIVDGKTMLIGSHNWSGSGVQFNRDASLVIYDTGVAQYYQDIFLHDWERRTARGRQTDTFMVTSTGMETGFLEEELVQLDWKEYLA